MLIPFRRGHAAPPGFWGAHGALIPIENHQLLLQTQLSCASRRSPFPLARTPQRKLTRKTPGCSGKSCHDQLLGASCQAWVTPHSRDARGAVWHVPHAGSLPGGENGAPSSRRAVPEKRPPGTRARRGCGGPVPGAERGRRVRGRSPAEDELSARRYLVGSRQLRAPAAGKKEKLQRAPSVPREAGRGQLSRGFRAALARQRQREGLSSLPRWLAGAVGCGGETIKGSQD